MMEVQKQVSQCPQCQLCKVQYMVEMMVLGSDVKVERSCCANLVIWNARWAAKSQQILFLYYVHAREKRKNRNVIRKTKNSIT